MNSPVGLSVAQCLKKIRTDRGMSLSTLAQSVGVSKAMLGQIEREESSPTINTLWKISSGLRIPLSQLLHPSNPDNLRFQEVIPHRPDTSFTASSDSVVSAIYPYDPLLGYEMYELNYPAGYERQSEPHYDGVIEQLTILEGQLSLWIGEQKHELPTGHSFRFQGDCHHRYHNTGKGLLRFLVIMHYPNGQYNTE